MKLSNMGILILTLLCAFLLAPGCDPVNAQVPDLKFKHLNVDDGLSQSTVSSIFQDRMGFMWFGTDIGINKYDGEEFTYYRHDATDTTGIPSNFIVSIFEDSYGYFWIGTGYSGLSRLDREKDIFYRYCSKPGDPNSLSSDNIRTVFEDSKKNLWIGTAGGGLNLFNRTNETFTHFLHDSLSKDDIGSNFITSIAEDRKGFLWLGSSEGVITRYDPAIQKGTCYELYDRNLTDKMTANFGGVYIDSNDDVWYCSENGLYWYNQKSRTFTHYMEKKGKGNLNENSVSDIEEIGNGLYMVATDHGGINILNKNTGVFSHHMHSKYDPLSISNDQIYSIFKSRDGIYWIGNYNGGINIYDPNAKKFLKDSDLPVSNQSFFRDGSVLAICEDSQGNIWFGYDGQGINIYNPVNFTIRHLEAQPDNPNSLRSNNIVEIFKSRSGDMWIGTYLEGLSKIDAKTGRYTHFKYNSKNPSGIGGSNVWTLLEDRTGSIWIGFVGNGLDRYDPVTGMFFHYTFKSTDSLGLCNSNVYKLFEDKSGNLWVGTRNGLGLYNRNSDNFKNFISGRDIKNGIYGNHIYDIYQDRDGNLWIGTDQALNLYNYADQTFEHYSPDQGLAGNAVLSISGDHKGNLWLGTNRGLSRFNTAEKKFRNFDLADGLLSNEFNYSASLESSSGHLFFGSKSGFNFFHPDSIFDNPVIPSVYITSLRLQNEVIRPMKHPQILKKHINYTTEIVLDYKQSVFTLSFAILNYSNSEKNRYSYMLEGFDERWNHTDNNSVTYTNIDPGHYTFRVKGANNDGLWNEEGARLSITILPPWWKTLWFRTLIYSLALALAMLLYYLRLALFDRQKKKLMLLVRERTLQLEEVAVSLEEKQEEINSQNEKLLMQRDELESNNKMLMEQKQQILEQNRELDVHRNQLESLVEVRTRELIEAKDKAEESDRLKSSFLANLSHEIRTPLNAILGFSSLLGEKNLNHEEREEYNRIIQSSSNNLLELINDILDISKIEAGQLEIDMSEVSLETVVHDMADIFDMFMKREDLGSNKHVELRVSIDESIHSAKIITDSLRLNQILANLINNAIKFTRKGFIEVGCSRLEGSETLEFYVKDTGIGIREEHQKLIFERFRKVEDDKIQLHRGTGLGLAISYQLVSLLGGSMRLVSEYGKGSAFYFTIPFITAASSTYKVHPRKSIVEEVPDLRHQVILVAEDDISNFNYIDKLLRKANARVLHAEDGNQVLRILEKQDGIAAILMDIKMPVMDGIEALHALRKSGIMIPVIAQTAYALADEVVKLKKEGFDDYISKPLQRQTLYCILQKYLIQDVKTTDQSP